MANQNPQPEIYTTRHVFGDNAAAIAAGTSVTQTIYTNQANNEEVRVYGIMVEIMAGGTGAAGGAFNGSNGPLCCSCDAVNTQPTCSDFDVKILVGANQVPSQSFAVTSIACKDDKTLTFPVPILVLFQQPLSIVVTNNTLCAGTPNRTIKVTLISELAIQSADCVDPSLIQG
tara:strand:- start:311 stop:829 length:519 start_codon:yes stop_codon:yes gene_type:complete